MTDLVAKLCIADGHLKEDGYGPDAFVRAAIKEAISALQRRENSDSSATGLGGEPSNSTAGERPLGRCMRRGCGELASVVATCGVHRVQSCREHRHWATIEVANRDAVDDHPEEQRAQMKHESLVEAFERDIPCGVSLSRWTHDLEADPTSREAIVWLLRKLDERLPK